MQAIKIDSFMWVFVVKLRDETSEEMKKKSNSDDDGDKIIFGKNILKL